VADPPGSNTSKSEDLDSSHVPKDTYYTSKFLLQNLLPNREDSDRSWTVPWADNEARGYDLKAVNPHRKTTGDERTPEQILEAIENHGREVTKALKELRQIC
jgi:type I restriction enzyme M protein